MIYVFNNINYSDEPLEDGVNLKDLSLGELAGFYNTVAITLNKPSINKFADKSSGVRRTMGLLSLVKPVIVVEKEEKKTRKKRDIVFNMPAKDNIRKIKGTSSVRYQCVELLKVGGTLEQVKDIIKANDKEPSDEAKLVRRAREMVRIINTYLGFGLEQDVTTGIIRIVK